MGIPFLLALSISSRRANSLLHFLKCVLSRPAPLVYPFSSFCTKNFHTKDLLTRTVVFEKVGGNKFLELELLPPPLLLFLSDIGLLPLYFSKFMFKSKIINIMKNKQR
ncbi:hypothetical protein H5410_001557 [Solanum commersonii]|uniref:Uncharacterized protein n=1 Tax=Solanum commersonii TaxID=4109 RepID=A0A9J6AZD7_SOLCO|nr:hypothetical protein H5410_001557 [Solanum commersonii]